MTMINIIREWLAESTKPDIITADGQALAAIAVRIALAERGQGEEGANNAGPAVRKYMQGASGNWCAGFAVWCYEQAAIHLGVPCPLKRSHGAKRLVRNMIAVGREVDWREEPLRPGDLIAFHRGAEGAWTGHVAMVSQPVINGPGIVACVQGNSGRYPSRVHERVHDLANERTWKVARL